MIQRDAERPTEDEASFEQAIRLACDAVAGLDPRVVRSSRVVMNRRLTHWELVRAQAVAAERGVRLTENGSGMIVVRRAPAAIPPRSGGRPGPATFRPTAVLDALRRAFTSGPLPRKERVK